MVQEAKELLQAAVRKSQQYGRDLRRHSQDIWRRGKRNPRMLAVTGGVVALTLVGAYALNAMGVGRSLCPPATAAKVQKGGKGPGFLLLMDQVPQAHAGSEVEIRYDVCGLPEGTPYSGRVRLSQQRPTTKKGVSKPKPLTVTFQDKADGPATRRSQDLALGKTKPGAYTLELSVVDKQGRVRKKLQKVVIKSQ